MTTRSNATRHWEIVDAHTGQTLVTEKCRDSIGGFANLTARLEEALGGQLHALGTSGDLWTVNGRTVLVRELDQ